LTLDIDLKKYIDLSKLNTRYNFQTERPGKTLFSVRIIDTTRQYVEQLRTQFDFSKLYSLFQRKDFNFCFDALNGIAGPYAMEIFGNIFKCNPKNLFICIPKQDFGGLRPDPNLFDAENLVKIIWRRQ